MTVLREGGVRGVEETHIRGAYQITKSVDDGGGAGGVLKVSD